jgi:hypothetical protein
MRILHVAQISGERWVVTLDDDAEPPISEHTTRGEAETSARAYAQTFGYPEIVVHHANGEEHRMLLFDEIETRTPRYPGGATGTPNTP